MARTNGKQVRADGGELVVASEAQAAALPVLARRALLESFLAGRKPTTLRAYQNDLSDFATWAQRPTPAAACDWLFSLPACEANAIVLAYRGALLDRGLAAATVARRLSALKSLGKCARLVGVCSWALEVEAPAVESYRDVRGPGDDGYRAMLATAQARALHPRGRRDVALLRLLHDLGLRRSEAVNIDLGDVELGSDGTPAGLWITGKGRTARERLTLPRNTAQALAAWLADRGDEAGPVFVRLDLGSGPARAAGMPRLSTESVRLLVRDLGERAGLAKPVRPHGLRHQAITNLLDRTNGDVRRVAKFSRHRDLRTLSRYDDARRDDAGELAALLAGDEALAN